MTVAEVIAELQKLPPGLVVIVHDGLGTDAPVETVSVGERQGEPVVFVNPY